MHELRNRYPENIYLMSGLHPVSVKDNYKEELNLVLKSLETHNYVGIGEIGIDLYWDKTFLKQQQEAFEFQIRLAISNNLPIVIHCRDGFDEIFEILDAEKCSKMRGIFHCFTGTLEQANRAINLGFNLGIGGVVTFKNGGIDKFLNKIDIKNIVLETDAPYLSPVPHRGKRNESFYVTYILKKISELYALNEQEIAKITSKNALEIFNI
jgi:TatD DNase family protein